MGLDSGDNCVERVGRDGRRLGSRRGVGAAVGFWGKSGGVLRETDCKEGWECFIESGIANLSAVIQICARLSIMCACGGQTRQGGGKGDRLE